MDWHACGTGFDTEKMALQLKMALNFHQEKVFTSTWDYLYLAFEKNALLPIILLRLDDWLGKKKKKRVILRAQLAKWQLYFHC